MRDVDVLSRDASPPHPSPFPSATPTNTPLTSPPPPFRHTACLAFNPLSSVTMIALTRGK